MHAAAGGGYPGGTLGAIWDLVFKGLVTNDLLLPLRAFCRTKELRGRRLPVGPGGFRSRREAPLSGEGRWSLVESRLCERGSDTAFGTAVAQQLLARYGLVTREVPLSESVTGGFSGVYAVLRAMEEGGRIRRGLFVADLGAAQFALPPVVDLLRSLRDEPDEPEIVTLSAADPANAWGALAAWPALEAGVARASRSVGAKVVLVNGALAAYIGRGGRQIFAWLPPDEPERSRFARAVAGQLAQVAARSRSGFEVEDINSGPARAHPLAPFLESAGFQAGPSSFYWLRRMNPPASAATSAD